ncbi:MAG: DUF4070 domain-containing protein, partial [Spirochaetota bacterium]
IQELAIPTAMVGLLMALPRTRLYERLESEGRILSQANGNNTHATLLNFVPRLPAEVLEAGYRSVLRRVYDPRRYFARCLELLRRYPNRPAVRTQSSSVKLREITGLLHSLVRQAFSRYGLFYLRYLILGVARRPRLIVRVVTLAVLGHHYFTMTRKTVRGALARSPARSGRRVGARMNGGTRIEPADSRPMALSD